MNQNGARKTKPVEVDDNASFLDDAFNERTIVHSGPSPLALEVEERAAKLATTPTRAPAPVPQPTSFPKASKKTDLDHTPISQPEPSRSVLDDVLNDRTMVISNKSSRVQSAILPEPKASDFEFSPPHVEKNPEPDFNFPPVPPVPPRAQSVQEKPRITSPPPPQPKHAETGSVSFDSVRPHDVPATDDWDFRAEKTHPGGVQHWVRKANAFPRQQKIAVAVIVVLGIAFVIFRGSGKAPEPVIAETEPKQQDHAQAPAKPVVPTVDSVLQLFDIAYAKTQGQARSDQNSP
jgi:hypothetical protein